MMEKWATNSVGIKIQSAWQAQGELAAMPKACTSDFDRTAMLIGNAFHSGEAALSIACHGTFLPGKQIEDRRQHIRCDARSLMIDAVHDDCLWNHHPDDHAPLREGQ